MSVNVVEGSAESHNPVEQRCDRCGARGYVIATNSSGITLVFCNHHGVEFQDNLIAQGFVVTKH